MPDVEEGPFSLPALTAYMAELLRERGMSAQEAIRLCRLDRGYGSQIFNGARRPTRNDLLALALALRLRATETQELLKTGGCPVLYARDHRDTVILSALARNDSPDRVDELLRRMGESPLL